MCYVACANVIHTFDNKYKCKYVFTRDKSNHSTRFIIGNCKNNWCKIYLADRIYKGNQVYVCNLYLASIAIQMHGKLHNTN